ncbi:MAG TPA: efflux RND transporter periplasmic adaptor subunit [Bacillota bacterium]|nr:efflux RND transporter periplasmic adaptor subunit [Bacillota bacterium]
MAQLGKSGWPKWPFVVIVLGTVTGAGVWYCKDDPADAPQYQTTVVSRGELTQAVTANGQLNPVVNIQVGSQISGNIQKLYADYNSLVKSNQVVAQLDPAIYQAIVHQSEGDLANARAGLELQQVEARRSEALFRDRLISQSEYDKAVANLHQSEAQVKIKESSLERAKVDLAHCTIYAPVDGIVISRSVDVGQTVAASMNAPTLFMIANDLTKMQIDAAVSEADVGTIEEGQNVSFTVDAFPSRTFSGKVIQIRNSPVTVQNVVTYDTVIEVSNPDLKLKPGMTATVSIITAQRTGVLKLPNAALRFRPPEPSTNLTVTARWLAKLGLGKPGPGAATNFVQAPKPGATNTVEVAEKAAAPLTGNEPPEELMKKVRELRERGEEPPAEVRAKLRELFQSGALQRSGGPRGGGGGGGGGGARPRSGPPAWRTVYVLTTNTPPGGDAPLPVPQPVRVRAGISDGTSTEILEGLKEGDAVVTTVRLPQGQAATPAPSGASPFGGGGGPGMRRF